MAYVRPGVTVTQEFLALLPELAPFNLPSCLIGPAYALINDDALGAWANVTGTFNYVSAPAASVVDLSYQLPTDLFPAAEQTMTVSLANAVLQIVAPLTTGFSSTTLTFNDATTNVFADVLVGDQLVISSGDNAGTYTVLTVVSVNQLTLQSPLANGSETALPYSINRKVASVALVRDTDYTASLTGITITAPLAPAASGDYEVLSGAILATYRALRNDLASVIGEYDELTDVQNTFGVSQISPANPLAFGLQIALQNTVTPVYGLGLSTLYATDESTAHQDALVVIKASNMYMLAPLSQNPLLAPLYSSFVTNESAVQRERACVVNRQLLTILTLQQSEATVTSLSGARTIVATQTTGASTSPNLDVLGSSALFGNVQLGDTVVIVSGTDSIPGNYTVTTVTSSSSIILSGNIATATTTALNYYIVRQDGISADGLTLYDRNAMFIENGVSTGDYITITAPSEFAGRYLVSNVLSDYEVRFAASINGVVSLVTAVTYDADRNMSLDEQAAYLAGYSTSIGNRRVVNIWPDILQAASGNVLVPVPGFYAGCALAGLTTGLPTQQGFTNLSITGFLGLSHSNPYFNDDQLDVIAGGGTMVLVSPGAQEALVIRHELTTNVTSIKFQEFAVTKNVDYISKYIRQSYASFVGPYNVIKTTLDDLKTTAKGIINYFVSTTSLPRIGGILRSGALVSLAEDPTAIDTVNLLFSFDIPIPLNHINVTIQV
jgi:hypothetical protein